MPSNVKFKINSNDRYFFKNGGTYCTVSVQYTKFHPAGVADDAEDAAGVAEDADDAIA